MEAATEGQRRTAATPSSSALTSKTEGKKRKRKGASS